MITTFKIFENQSIKVGDRVRIVDRKNATYQSLTPLLKSKKDFKYNDSLLSYDITVIGTFTAPDGKKIIKGDNLVEYDASKFMKIDDYLARMKDLDPYGEEEWT